MSRSYWSTWWFASFGSIPHPQGRWQEPRAPRRADVGSRSLAVRSQLHSSPPGHDGEARQLSDELTGSSQAERWPGNCWNNTVFTHLGDALSEVSWELSFVWSLQPGWRQLRSLLPSFGGKKVFLGWRCYRMLKDVADKIKAPLLERGNFHRKVDLYFILTTWHPVWLHFFRSLKGLKPPNRVARVQPKHCRLRNVSFKIHTRN